MTLLFLFVLGLAVGSFLNVLIDRLPKDKSIIGRSHCDFCKKKLTAKDLVPVFSFIFLGGKCRYCGKKLSWQYPGIEFLTGVVFVLVYLYQPTGSPLELIAYLGLVSGLIVLLFADWKYHIIPDQIQITLLLFSAIILYLQGDSSPFFWLIRLRDGIITMLPILLIYLVTKGKGIGFGDVKLAFIIGFFLKIIAAFYAIYFAFIIGAFYGSFLLLSKKKRLKDAVAFGPFMALGFAGMIFYGRPIISFFEKYYFQVFF